MRPVNLIVLFASLAAVAPCFATGLDDSAPGIRLSVDRLDFGTLSAGRVAHRIIEIESVGQKPLHIGRVGVNCSCARLKLSTARRLNVSIDKRDQGRTDLTLQPGEKATLKLLVDTGRLPPGELTKRCLIFSNDTANSPVSIPFTLSVKPAVVAAAAPTTERDAQDIVSPVSRAPISADGPQPRIEASDYVHRFGEVFRGEVMTHIFKLKNTGEGPLFITRVTGSCSCMANRMWVGEHEYTIEQMKRGTLTNAVLQPGEEARLEVKMETAALIAGKERSSLKKYVRVHSNDRTRTPMQLTVEANLVEAVKMEPRKIKMGALLKRSIGEATTQFWPTRIDTFEVKEIIAPENSGITADIQQIGEKNGRKLYELRVKVDTTNARVGIHKEQLRIDLKHDRVKALVVPIEYEVMADIEFIGNSKVLKNLLDFGRISGAEDVTVDLAITNHNPKVPYVPSSVEIHAKPSKVPFSAEIVEVEKGVQYTVRVTVSKDISLKFFQGTLLIKSEHPEARAKAIRFKGLVTGKTPDKK